ncbi:Ig-like domain-containing protein [Anaerotignum sp.]|uniref:Ig-like domain-containing protein n=1 Tax=Anaerotignum sp. TaxID=2039241 RepID=UPI002A91200C|nr:Ig-like domain-containing protein [Anaerotignum sp.]MCI7658193.1 Ig-like domain-containing protein [Clostridia bacterium]MDY5415227.1 Ig-like domain-containing protein [Anaerotignum sp.]
MKKKSAITITAVLTASMVMSVTAFGAPRDIQGHWAQNTINKWVDKGDISGYPDGTFRPNNMITRAEFVVLVNNAMGYTKSGYAYFSDVPSYYWGKNAIQTGVEAGYISGDGDGTFRPNDPVTRQEAAAMISRILGLKQNDSQSYRYTDSYAISNWAKGVVGAVSDAGIMAGYPDGSFGPNRVLTRAEAVLALDKTVNYKPGDKEDDKEETKKEDMLLTQTKLEDTTITGDLTISDRLGTKTITLEDVTVKGKLIVDGGKEVILKDCDIKEMVMDQKDTTVKASGKTTVEKTTFKKIGKLTGGDYTDVIVDKELSGSITIDAKVRNLTLDAETDLKLGSDARIKNMEITKNADKATIEFSKAKVEDMTVKDKITIKGNGNIDTMTVYVSDVNTSIRPDTVKTKDGASKPNYTDDDDDWWRPNRRKSITVTSNHTGGTYRNVTVAATGVELKDTTVLDHLYIDAKVGNGTAILTNLSVSGNVYVNGGGDHSVIFENCSISGNIYAQKTDGSQQVALKFDEKTADKLKGSVIVKENGALLQNKDGQNVKLQKVTVETDSAVTIDTNVKDMQVTKATTALTVNGTVDKLQADQNVTVNGNGRINEKTGAGQIEGNVKIGVTGVRLEPTEITLNVKGTTTLKATVAPENATDQTVTWESSDNQVATVENGVVTAKAPGKATITVKTVDGGKTATCEVTVDGQPINVPVQSVGLNQSTLTLSEGEGAQLTANFNPENATNKNVTWKSDNEAIAKVNEKGEVVGQKEGKTNITVTTEDGGKTAVCEVTVKKANVPVQSVGLNNSTLALSEGEGAQLTAHFNPENATNQNVTWRSDNENIAKVNEKGEVVGQKEGKAIITVTTEDGGKTATCEVTVKKAVHKVEGVGLNQSTLTLSEGEGAQLTAHFNPENATNQNVTWRSENTEIAKVNEKGEVVGQKEGTTNIIVTTEDGGKTATCAVTVKKAVHKVESVGLNNSTLSLSAGESGQLTAHFNPENATNKNVAWNSNKPEVAMVDNNGKVMAQAPGTATITVTTEDGNKTATCTVTVLSVNKDKLNALLQFGNDLLKTPVSVTGSEFSSNQKWVTEAEKQALQTAVNSAKTVYDSSNAEPNAVDTAYRNLQTAVTTFQKAMKSGTKVETRTTYSFWNLW